jgi:hypothetical protein
MSVSGPGVAAAPASPVLPGIRGIPGLPGLPGVDVGGSLTSALQRLVGQAVHGFASSMFAHLSDALLATTTVPLGATFDAPWRAMLAVAALFALPILLAGVTTEVLAGRPGQAVRRGVLLPLLIGPVLLAARTVLTLLVALVQGACGLMVQIGLGGEQGFAEGIDAMRQALGVATGPADPSGAGASLVVVLIAGMLAFVIWVELAVRAALLLLLAAFVPLALSGLFWSRTARWTRRLLESLAAVLLAPLVITMVMVLATATLTAPAGGLAQGINQAAIALALLFLGTLGLPLTFRLVPLVVEAAVVTGAGANVARRAQRGAARLATAAPTGGAATRLSAVRVATPGAGPRGPAGTAVTGGAQLPAAGAAASARPGAPGRSRTGAR